MNCTDVAAILDEHAQQRLTPAERCALDEHVVGCEPCASTWRAQMALLALPLPATPADLVERALRAMDARAPRRARLRLAVVGAVLAVGAAFAAATAIHLLERTEDQPAAASAGLGDAPEPASPHASAPQTSAPPTQPNIAGTTAVSVEDVQIEYAMMIRTPPAYPRDALARKLDGDVTVSFTIDKGGTVKNVRAVRSSDPQFEAPAIAAVSQWKYLPRVVAGKRVSVDGVQTVLRFVFEPPSPPKAAPKAGETPRQFQLKAQGSAPAPVKAAEGAPQTEPKLAHPADYEVFDRSTAVVWQRIVTDDLRGAELELDELRATYDLDDRQSNQVWGFYGYIYTQYGDYGRAIDSYEKAVAFPTNFWQGQWTSLASLYFARHQYDRALKTLLAYKNRSSGRMDSEATAMIEKLRALGVTEETL